MTNSDAELRKIIAESKRGAAAIGVCIARTLAETDPTLPRRLSVHAHAMYQALFANDEFARVVPWLMLNRQGLTVLVHPSTGDAYGDHLDRSLWLGEVLQLKTEVLRRS